MVIEEWARIRSQGTVNGHAEYRAAVPPFHFYSVSSFLFLSPPFLAQMPTILAGKFPVRDLMILVIIIQLDAPGMPTERALQFDCDEFDRVVILKPIKDGTSWTPRLTPLGHEKLGILAQC